MTPGGEADALDASSFDRAKLFMDACGRAVALSEAGVSVAQLRRLNASLRPLGAEVGFEALGVYSFRSLGDAECDGFRVEPSAGRLLAPDGSSAVLSDLQAARTRTFMVEGGRAVELAVLCDRLGLPKSLLSRQIEDVNEALRPLGAEIGPEARGFYAFRSLRDAECSDFHLAFRERLLIGPDGRSVPLKWGDCARLRRCMEATPPGLALATLAAETGLPESTLRNQIHNANKRLRRLDVAIARKPPTDVYEFRRSVGVDG